MKKQELVDFFSKFWSIDKNKITDDLKLDDSVLKGAISIRLYQFFAEIESKFGVKVNNVNSISTFGNLLKNIH